MAAETFKMLKKEYGDACLSRTMYLNGMDDFAIGEKVQKMNSA